MFDIPNNYILRFVFIAFIAFVGTIVNEYAPRGVLDGKAIKHLSHKLPNN
jgi:hypothetical protein